MTVYQNSLPLALALPDLLGVIQNPEYTRVLNMPLVLNIRECEYSRIPQGSDMLEYA